MEGIPASCRLPVRALSLRSRYRSPGKASGCAHSAGPAAVSPGAQSARSQAAGSCKGWVLACRHCAVQAAVVAAQQCQVGELMPCVTGQLGWLVEGSIHDQPPQASKLGALVAQSAPSILKAACGWCASEQPSTAVVDCMTEHARGVQGAWLQRLNGVAPLPCQ